MCVILYYKYNAINKGASLLKIGSPPFILPVYTSKLPNPQDRDYVSVVVGSSLFYTVPDTW